MLENDSIAGSIVTRLSVERHNSINMKKINFIKSATPLGARHMKKTGCKDRKKGKKGGPDEDLRSRQLAIDKTPESRIRKERKNKDRAIETRRTTNDALDQSTRDHFVSLSTSGKETLFCMVQKQEHPINSPFTRMRSTQQLLTNLVDVPLNAGDATSVERASDGLEESARQIDGGVVTAHALVNNGTSLGNAVVGDGHGLAAVRVGHDTVGQSKDELGGAVVGGAARAGVGSSGGSVVVGNVTSARGALIAGAVVARAGSGARAGAGRGSSRGSGRSRAGLGGGGLNDGGGSGGRGSDRGGGGGGSLLLLQGLSGGGGLNGGGGLDSGGGDDGNDGSSGVATGVDGGGHIDGLPDDISDGLPHDGALVEGSSEARDGKEGTSEGEGLGDWGHFERLLDV